MFLLVIFFIISFLFLPKKTVSSFDKDCSIFLKAVLPFFIILHHSCGNVLDFSSMGVYVVALFFFVSGYGMEKKKLSDDKLSILSVAQRIKKLLLPIFIPSIFYILLKLLYEQSFLFILDDLNKYKIIVPYSWFVLSLLQMYLLFFISWLISSKHSMACLVILITIYIAAMYTMQIHSTYYCSLYGFLFGGLFAHAEKIVFRGKKVSIYGLIVLLISFFLNMTTLPLERMYGTVLFCLGSVIMISSVNCKNKTLKFLDGISYEIYLCQGGAFLIAKLLTSSQFFILLLTVIITIPCAIVSNYFTKKIFSKYY